MCDATTYSESGARLTPARCADFLLLQSDRDRLAGVVAGMEEQNARNLEELHRLRKENARLRTAIAPILKHADSHDYAPPIRLSVRQCRDIKEKVNANP